MTNKTIESPSTSVSKDAPVSRKFDYYDKLEKIIDAVDTDEMIEFDNKWFGRLNSGMGTPNRDLDAHNAVKYVVGVLGARKGDDRFRKFANMLKEEDDGVIRTVLEFTQDLRDTLEKSMRSATYETVRKNCSKLLKQLDYYEDTVLKPASLMLSDTTANPNGQSPADGSNRNASKKSLESIAEDVLRSRYGASSDEITGSMDEYIAHFVRYYVPKILEAAGMKNLREKGGVINANKVISYQHKLTDGLYKDRGDTDALKGVYDTMNSIAEAVEEFGANATDARSKGQYEDFKRQLDIANDIMENSSVFRPFKQPPAQPEQPPVEQPEQPPVEQPEQPPVEQPEQPPVEQPPVEQSPAGYSSKDEFKKALEDAMNEVLDPWRDMVENEKEFRLASGEGEDKPTTNEAIAGRVIEYVDEAMAATKDMMIHARKNKPSPKADEARSRFNKIIDTLKKENDRDVVEGVYEALSRMSEKVEEFRANAPDDDFEKICDRYAKQTDIAKTRVAFPSYQRRQILETPKQRAERLNRVALELGVPQQVMTDTLYDLSDFEQDALYDVIDALNDVHSAKWVYGNDSVKGKADRIRNFDDTKSLEQNGLLKARKALSECYSELGEDSVKRLLYVVNRMRESLSNSPDAMVRTVAGSLNKVLGQMAIQYRYDAADMDYTKYLNGIPGVPEDWGPDFDEKLKNLENLNDDLMYILSRDGTNERIGKYFPPNVNDPLRFLVEHYMPPSDDPAAFKNWKNTEPILRELAEQLPWGGVDTEHTVNMLVPLLQDAQRFFTDTRPATPYERYMSKLADESERTQRMMARNDFRFERYEYIKRLRQAYGIGSKKYRSQMLNGILDDMSKDIASIRNLGVSANDPLPRNLKEDTEFLRNGANSFKKDLEQLRDAVIGNMNGEAVEPPGWTGFRNWEELLDPRNPLEGRAVDGAKAMKNWEENEVLHTMHKRKYIPKFERRDMWNNPEGDPLKIMRELRGRNIIPGAHPEYSTQPIIGPRDFRELSAMVGPGDGRNSRSSRGMNPEEYEELLHAFSQKALYIANNLAFDMRNEADAKAVRQFEQALEIAGRCRGKSTAGTSRRGLSYDSQYRMYRRALRD